MPTPGATQVPPPPIEVPGVIVVGKERYGPVQPAEVSELETQQYLDRAVRTRGLLEPLDLEGRYYTLSDGGSRVVLIPAGDFHDDYRSVRGRRVEVEGYVRRLVERQGTCGPSTSPMPKSICDNPELPPTPDLVREKASWPRVSITTWYVGDITAPERKRGESRDLIGDVLDPQSPSDKPVRIVGRFCGASLCGGLGEPPVPKAWVLADDVSALWVIGKEPSGKGWRLDPAYRGDTSRWLEVVGRVEPCGATRCLRAKSLALVPRPGLGESP